MEASKAFGQKLKFLRHSRKLTQEEMAHRLNIEQKTYSNIENGKTAVTLDRINEIADVFAMNVLDLIGFDEKLIPFRVIHLQFQL
jgi:transcriptional regulator with XRE-family HTH domain